MTALIDGTIELTEIARMMLGTVPLLLALAGAYLRLRSRLDALEVHMANQRDIATTARGELMARIVALDERKVDVAMCRGMHKSLEDAINALRQDMRSLDEALRLFAMSSNNNGRSGAKTP